MASSLSEKDARTYSEREMVLAKRAESARSRCAALFAAKVEGGARISLNHVGYDSRLPVCSDCLQMAARRFPLPMVERPRIVKDPSGTTLEWSTQLWHDAKRVIVHRAQCFPSNGEWCLVLGESERDGGWVIVAERVAIWADLLANPTELVPDEGSESDQEGSR